MRYFWNFIAEDFFTLKEQIYVKPVELVSMFTLKPSWYSWISVVLKLFKI